MMKPHLIYKILLTYMVAALPAMAQGALVDAAYPNSVSAPQQSAVTPSEGPGGGGGGTSKADNPPSQGGNVNAVSSILHPRAAKETIIIDTTPPEPMTKLETQERLLDDSINAYPGPCACPYSRNSDGFECGVEAAYYKPGGYRIYCYPEDLRGQLYIFYRKTH